MLPGKFALLVFAELCVTSAGFTGRAQQVPLPTPVRFHVGDDARWADPNFDDSSWSLSVDGHLPPSTPQADGFIWSRLRVIVPESATGPLALRWSTPQEGAVQEVFVNGVPAGRTGDFPPHLKMRMVSQNIVFDLPAGLGRAGTVAEVAIRGWTVIGRPTQITGISIDSATLQHAIAGQLQTQNLLGYMPQFAVSLLLEVLGLGVLILGLWSGRKELLLCAIWLVSMPVYLTSISLISLVSGVNLRLFQSMFALLNALGMAVVVEFIWTVQGFRDRRSLWLARVLWVLTGLSDIAFLAFLDEGRIVARIGFLGTSFLFAFNLLLVSADLVALSGRGRNRAIAAADLLISVGFFLNVTGHQINVPWLRTDFFGAAFYLSSVVIAGLLIRQTWEAWKKNDDLRIEVAAARELQQQLVPLSLPSVAGLELDAAYMPALEVGGDFYQVMKQRDGASLILVGDVSGKGLRAAMTGVLTIGAARVLNEDVEGPAELLTRLNREMMRSSMEGFVTCLCAAIGRDGKLRLANAGHLAPYLNGEELPVESGLPLGILAGVEYSETVLCLSHGDSITFLSDGVVEAQNAAGELFGFARTKALATRSAEEIALAAKAFGQADDITVLTLGFAPVA
jgi:serine phosphatase RsbU (regulator of sigma subunit)